MAFYVVMSIILLLALCAGWSVRRQEDSVFQGILCFLLVSVFGGGLTMLVLGAIGSAFVDSAEHRLLKTETMVVAEGSLFETKYGSVRFVEKRPDDTLVPQDIDYSKIEYASKSIKAVQVLTYEIHHSAIFPWTWGETHHVVIK